jgi:hypothetical protein
MKRLDQDHLHPKLEGPETDMSRPGIVPGLRGGSQALQKRPFELLVENYSEHLHTV